MIVRVDHAAWNACLVVAHAPQGGQTEAERQHWWIEFGQKLQEFTDGAPLFVLIDANAAPGSHDGQAVGLSGLDVTKNTPFSRGFLGGFACHARSLSFGDNHHMDLSDRHH